MARSRSTAACALGTLLATAASGQRPIDAERVAIGGVMGTDYRLTAIGPDADGLETALAAAIAELQRIEDLMTDWRASPLSSLNDAAGSGPTEVPAELAQILARSLAMGDLTDGAFDITFAGVGKLWDFRRTPPIVPDDAAIAAALANVGHTRVVVNAETGAVMLPAGFRLGLGGIAKGYGIDRAMDVLRRHGVRHAVVSVGGDLKVLGRNQGEPWEIGIAHPRERDRALAVLRLSNTCVVTSGDYERFFEIDGVRYHHILDPRTGRPSRGCISATVVAPNAEYADALATALCVLGPQRGLELVAKLPRVEAIVVGLDGAVSASPGLLDSVRSGRATVRPPHGQPRAGAYGRPILPSPRPPATVPSPRVRVGLGSTAARGGCVGRCDASQPEEGVVEHPR